MNPQRFHILPYSLPASHIPHLLGRIVLDPLNPLRQFIPDPSDPSAGGFNPEDIVPNLLPLPVISHDHTAVARAASSARLRARLSEYLGLETGVSASAAVELRAAVVRRYEMANHSGVFRRFMAHDGFRGLIEGMLAEGKRGEALMVVGFYTAENARWVASRTRGREHGVDVQVPVGAVVGLPVGVDPGVGASVERIVEQSMEGEVQGEEVFAVAYDVVRRKHSLDRTVKGWVSSTLVLGDEKRVQAGHLGMGRESDGELEYESEEECEGPEMACVLDGDTQRWETETGKLLDYIEL